MLKVKNTENLILPETLIKVIKKVLKPTTFQHLFTLVNY